MTCPHDLAERETACAEGMCPICAAAEIERLTADRDAAMRVHVEDGAEIERLRALLLRHQVAAWCEEDSDLAVETRAAIGERCIRKP